MYIYKVRERERERERERQRDLARELKENILGWEIDFQ